MTANTMRIGASRNARARTGAFFRGFIEGATGLFGIFRSNACQPECGTFEDDARELCGDVEQIAQDFHAVVLTVKSTAKK